LATQDDFLDLLWQDINSSMQEHWIENVIRASEKDPNAPFADLGPALKRLLALGASRQDLSLLVRHASYEQAFSLLYLLNDPGIDDNEIDGLHEALLVADPSGQEGRPGSAPPLKSASDLKAGRNKRKFPATTTPKPGKRKLLKSSQEVCFSPDGNTLATLGRGLTIWKCPEIGPLAKISTVSNPCNLAFSPDSRLLAVKNTSGRITLIDPSTQSTTRDFRNQADGQGSNVVFADDREHVVDASWEGVHFVRTLEGKITFREVFKGDMVTGVLRHPNGRYWFRHVRPVERLFGRTWPFKPGEFEELIVPLDGWDYKHAAFSPDGHVLAISAGLEPIYIVLVSFPAMEVILSVPIPCLGRGLCPLSFSPCGRILAVVGDAVAVLNATTLEVLGEIPIEYGCDVSFSPTAPLVAVGSSSVGEVFDTTRFLNALPS
jgi:WD40 repeat protein